MQIGDFIEYEVTVENRGTLNAVLENVDEQIISQNEAILITFSGYTKGEKLAKGASQKIIVRIEYNPEFNGTPEIGKTEISFTLTYAQAEGGVIKPIYNITTSKNNIVNLTVIPDTISAKEGDTVTFSVPTSPEYTYVGSYIYDDLDNKIIELDNSEKSFIMPNHDIRIAPIFKYNNFTIMNGPNRDTTFNFKNLANAATPLTYSTDYTTSHVLSLMSDLSAWDFGGLYSTKKYNLSKYSSIIFSNNAEILSGTTARNAYFGVVKDINKGLVHDNSNNLKLSRQNVNSTKLNSTLNIDSLENDTNSYHIGIEYSTANVQTRLYIWSIILIGRTYYS